MFHFKTRAPCVECTFVAKKMQRSNCFRSCIGERNGNWITSKEVQDKKTLKKVLDIQHYLKKSIGKGELYRQVHHDLIKITRLFLLLSPPTPLVKLSVQHKNKLIYCHSPSFLCIGQYSCWCDYHWYRCKCSDVWHSCPKYYH